MEMNSLLVRARWAAIGAAMSALLAGSVGVADASLNKGDRPVLVAITPCRLVDTRPATQVGPRNTPLGAQQFMTVSARGKQGNCNLPSDAIGLSLNVTATNATTTTNLRIYPADAPVPLASNLNPSPSQAVSWNAVATDLSGSGQFRVYNWAGSVNVIVDVAGYYVNHTHDDRYYTKAQVEAGFGDIVADLNTKANAADVYTKAQVNTIANTKADKNTVNAGFDSLTNALNTKADKANTYTKAEVYNKTETYDKAGTNLAIDTVAAERTARFDKQLDQRTVAAGRINNNGTLGRSTSGVSSSSSGVGVYSLTITAPDACETLNAPVVTATAVSATPIIVNVATDPVACTNNAFTVQIKTYNLAGAAATPEAVLFTAIGTNWPDPDVTP